MEKVIYEVISDAKAAFTPNQPKPQKKEFNELRAIGLL
jgi:hypothetical protein